MKPFRHSLVSAFAFMFALGAVVPAARGSTILWFGITGNETVITAGGAASLVVDYTNEDGLQANSVMIKATSGGALTPSDTTLKFIYDTIDEQYDDLITRDENGDWVSDLHWNPVNLTGYDVPGTTLTVGLYYREWDDSGNVTKSVLLAQTNPVSVGDMSQYITEDSGDVIPMPPNQEWGPFLEYREEADSPTPIPEPGSGMLIALGAMLLALRRRPETKKVSRA